MTITFECTPAMRATSPGVVHVDGTARPQIIDTGTAPDFFAILSAYHDRTGIPSLINTSFNLHGEPIVCSPQDALRSFQQGRLDYLAIGNLLVANPGGALRNGRRRDGAAAAA
jgi:carbamoyltransferase